MLNYAPRSVLSPGVGASCVVSAGLTLHEPIPGAIPSP
jgi:hypothetical protein